MTDPPTRKALVCEAHRVRRMAFDVAPSCWNARNAQTSRVRCRWAVNEAVS